MRDEAWEKYKTCPTNYRLKKGDIVELKCSTVVDNRIIIPAGIVGEVICARTPRITEPINKPKRMSLYFANVDCDINYQIVRIRVPHAALKIIKGVSK